MITRLRLNFRRDDGVALITAMGIAIVGMMVLVVLVSMVVMAVNDSGRDRVRTIEVHAAEAALDSTMAALEAANICDYDPPNYGEGSQEAAVDITIEYFNDAGAVDCTGGVFSAEPTNAVITSTATSVQPQAGIDPVRTVQTEVIMTPRIVEGVNAAIFSGGTLTNNGNSLTVNDSTDGPADIWLEAAGEWECTAGSGNKRVYGSVYLPLGYLTIGNNCLIVDDVWTESGLYGGAGENVIGGDLTVRNGTVSSTHVSGSALIADTTSGVTADYGVSYSSAIPTILPADGSAFPQLVYDPGTYYPGFPVIDGNSDSLCTDQWKNTVTLSSSDAVYNFTGCDLDWKNNLTLEINADTVIWANSISGQQTYVVSGGGDHKLWIMVPWTDGVSEGDIDLRGNALEADANVQIFIYTPGEIYLNPHGNFHGQLYGGTDVTFKNKSELTYAYVEIPGYDFSSDFTQAAGYDLEIVYKREVTVSP